MTGNEIRETFLSYFEREGHTRVRSSPLLPANDPTLLFTNAGMNQFKDVFLGIEKRDYVRAASSQKCVRAGGKHNDLDEVGKTARHHTFFEMLGNFSFGDYFKREAIQFAWDFLVNELKLNPERMWFTVFAGDDETPADEEAAALWVEAGARPERVLRFGRKDNFWQMAETGPCGPNTEISYYLGEHPEDPAFNRADLVNGPGDINMEIWNLVFMQYNRIEIEPGKYKLEPLPAPSVDTGAGLERLAVVLQSVSSNYDTDLIRPIIEFTAQLCSKDYEVDSAEGFAMRVIADHARATAFSIADSILPGNEGRNYVLRKIMRRAIYHGRHTLNFDNLFFYKVTDFVVDLMREAYPELEASRDFIARMVKLEEERFYSALSVGLRKLDEVLKEEEHIVKALILQFRLGEYRGLGKNTAFQRLFKRLAPLNDTFGLPRDLIRVSLEEKGLVIPEEIARSWFDFHIRTLQKSDLRGPGTESKVVDATWSLVEKQLGPTEFIGYDTTTLEDAEVVALFYHEDTVDVPEEIIDGEGYQIILDRTPFYAAGGGQVGDTGVIIHPKVRFVVNDTIGTSGGLVVHNVKAECEQSVNDQEILHSFVIAQVDSEKRDATRRNHTATHLLHAALREVLGGHVKQSGSVVAPNYLRFDFTHFQPLTEAELAEIERLVNNQVLRNVRVQTDIMPVEDAIRSGAMALFGEKYAGLMRVLTVPGFSKELCGGTHVSATGDIGLFKIVSDESIASGVRRIRAVTGVDAFERFRETELLVDKLAVDLRSSRADLPAQVHRLQEELKKAKREAEELKLKIATSAISSSANGDESREIAGVTVLAREASGLDAAGMRQLSDTLLARIKSGVVILGRSSEGKASLIVRSSPDVASRVPAGLVIKELAPIVGGRGGGKPDMAEGGGSQPENLSEALAASYQIVKKLLT